MEVKSEEPVLTDNQVLMNATEINEQMNNEDVVEATNEDLKPKSALVVLLLFICCYNCLPESFMFSSLN